MSSPPFGAGTQFIFDNFQRFVRSGLKVWLRVKNFPETGDYLEVGVPFAATGTTAVGFTDYLISPPPNVQDVSMHNIGLLAGRLNFGSRIFTVSHSFVKAQMALMGPSVTDPYAVWRERDGNGSVIGLIYNGRLFDIVDPRHREIAGKTISWKLICNALETVISNPPTVST